MIRRLFLCQPLTDEEAAAANAWAEKLGDDSLRITHRPAPHKMRVLLFDAVNTPGKGRKAKVRLLDDPAKQAAQAITEAVETDEIVFNVYTGREDNRSMAWAGTDAVFTVAFPDGSGVAFWNRVAGGIAPGVAAQCVSPVAASRGSAWFIPKPHGWGELRDSIRYLFFKVRPVHIRVHEERVILFAEGLLAEVPGF